MTDAALIVCHDCDLLHRRPQLRAGQRARCRRCSAVIAASQRGGLDTSLALSLTALMLFAVANSAPLLELSLGGQVERTTLLGAVVSLREADMPVLALVVLVTSVLAPLVEILGMIYVLAPLRLGASVPGAIVVFRALESVRPWGMVEVYLLALLIAIVKLSDLATVHASSAMYAFAVLVFVMAGAVATLDEDLVWHRLGASR